MKLNRNVLSIFKDGQLKKCLRIMKITLFLILFLTLQMSASVWSQTTTMSVKLKNSTLQELFLQIEKSSNYRFFYNNDEVDVNQRISVDAEEKTVGKILTAAFEGLPYSFKELDNKLILIERNGAKPNPMGIAMQQQKTISGKVTDSSGASLPGVSVVIKGTTVGTITNADGNYSLSNIPANAILQFSFVGMKTQEVAIGSKTTINVTLADDAIGIEEVVAVGYGVQKKVNLSGSVASMRSSDLKVTSTSTAQALQGHMPGVQITQNSGAPGSTSTIKIRGVGSLKSDNSPLIVVDGFIADKMDDVAAGDIESVSVLKDAASSAIYGARAANGVVLITTKRGSSGKMQVDFNAEYGTQEVTKLPHSLNSRDYAQKQNEQRAHSSLNPFWTGALAPENLIGGTDWFDYVYGNKAPIQNYRVGISGGSEATKYAISVNYIDQEGIVKGTSYNRLNLRSNYDHKFSKRVKLSVNLDLKDNNGSATSNQSDLILGAIRSSPTIPINFPDGSPGIYLQSRPGEISTDGTLSPNWLSGRIDNTSKGISTRITTALEIGLYKGLLFKTVFNGGINYNSSSNWKDKYSVSTPELPNVVVGGNSTNSLQKYSDNSSIWEVQELLTYNASFGHHNLNALGGFSSEKRKSENFNVLKENFPNNDLQVLNAGNNIISSSGNASESAITSLFGQVNYDYAGKYLFQANVRRDGSSVFAPGHQFGIFPSFSAAWRLSEENFMKEIPVISNFKIRTSYGRLGNAAIPQYAWISSYNLSDAHPFGSNPQSFYSAYYLTGMPNENIKWETTTIANLGIDFGLYKNRLTAVFDYYSKKTTDLLLNATIPLTAGYSAGPMVNIGAVQNKGWEFTLAWNDKVGSFEYGASVNFSHNDNKVVDMGGIKPIQSNGKITKEGLPINSFWGYKTDGIFRTKDEIASYPHLAGDLRPGDWKYVDISGPEGVPDGKIDSNDLTYLGNVNPDLFYGINLMLGWKGLDLNILFNGEAGKHDFQETVSGMGPDKENIMQYWFDNRAILGSDGNVISGSTPAMGSNFVLAQYSDGGNLYNTSYFRVKNIQLGYTFPRQLLGKIGVNTARIYINAVNPLLFTNYIGYDPETTFSENSFASRGGSYYYPVSKSYTVGISLKF
jgi:TonB-linked SusC/RagA family outer membrane protein